MKVAGLMAVSDFIMAPQMLRLLQDKCDKVILRYDVLTGDSEVLHDCMFRSRPFTELEVIRGVNKWNRWNWREDLIRALDRDKPDYVLFLDSDECFSEGFDVDFANFIISGKDIMMFDYTMATVDGRDVKKYPGAKHCKAFRWVPGITYRPYRGYAKPTWPGGEPKIFNAKTKVRHFCFWTLGMEERKTLHK